ncbi:unnamed protein product [Aphanomyces euteiches]|uniref:Nucleotide-diphospho-sugar transferase domain-containing protein n=1 Tax=Aphanomyces euteiches TaxID=100861 RepID=A0A6G0W4M0_9STRA|nr:hypothetical protein Ae201684_019001 [Aphanomyces euteiches]
MPILMGCIVLLLIVYIYVINSMPMIDGKEVYLKISKDQWLTDIKLFQNFSHIKRGIVVCLFDAMVPMAASLVLELRALGNTDLVQMYHCNGELSASSQRILYMIDANVEIVDACKSFVLSGKLPASKANGFRSFWLKPLALLHTRLDEVIILDADDLLFQDPARLWDLPGYKQTGTVFFYDREVAKAEYLNHLAIVRFQRMTNLRALIESFDYAKFGLRRNPSVHLENTLAWNGDSGHEQDSSIVVVNKAKAPLAMEVMWQLLLHDRYSIEFSYGDKELFWLSFELAQLPYFFSPWANSAAAMPRDMEKHPETLCGGLAQWMPSRDAKGILLHINGGYILNPYRKNNIHSMRDAQERTQELLAKIPRHVSKHRTRSKGLTKPEDYSNPDGFWPQECMFNRGSEPMREQDIESIKRRIHSAVGIAQLQQREIALDKLLHKN